MSSRKKGPYVPDKHFAEGDDSVKPRPSFRQVRKVTNRSSRQKSTKLRSLQPAGPGRPRGRPARKSCSRSCSDEQTCTTEKNPSIEKCHIANKRPFAGKYCSVITVRNPLIKKLVPAEKHRSVEKHATQKRSSVENHPSDVKGRTTGRSSSTGKHHSKRHLSGKRRHFSEKKCSSEKHLSAEKDLLAGRGHLTKKSRPTEKGHSAKEGSFTERSPYCERGRPIKRGRPAKKSLSTNKHPSTEKDYLDGRDPSTENHHAEEKDPSAETFSTAERDHQIERGLSVKRRLSREKDRPAGRGHHNNIRPAEEGRSVGWGNSAERRPPTGEDRPRGRGRPPKRSGPAEEGHSVEWGNFAERTTSTGQDGPRGRGQPPPKRSLPAEEGYSVKWGNSAERTTSTGEDRPRGRSQLPKKSRCVEKHLSAERSCAPKKRRPAKKGLTAKGFRSVKKVHSRKRGHLSKESSNKSNTVENGCSVEKGHLSMGKGFPIEKPDSGSIPKVPVRKKMQNTPESRSGSGTSKVPQITHQNVARAVNTLRLEQAVEMRRGIDLKLPQVLKPCLVEDWDLVNKQKKLYRLPAIKTVDTILAEYVTFVKSQGRADNREYSVDELVVGVREYFNKMLGPQLLCDFEKPQYAEMHFAHRNIPMSQIYGAPHLLRLFVKFGAALVHSPLSRPSLRLLCSYMRHLLKYLSENSANLFSASNYKVASVEYCRKAQWWSNYYTLL